MAGTSNRSQEAVEALQQAIIESESQRREQRRQFNFDLLIQGRVAILRNDECVADLVKQLATKAERDPALNRNLLISLGEAVLNDDQLIRERALMVLSQAGEHAYYLGDKGAIFLVIHCLSRWLRSENAMPAGVVVVLKRLEELVAWLIEQSLWDEAEKVVGLLSDIVSGQIAKGPALKSLVGQTLQHLAGKANLEKIADAYLCGDEQQPSFKRLLHCFNRHAIPYLLGRIHRSLSRKERLMLLALLPGFGVSLIEVAHRYTASELPWTILRNIVLAIGELGREEGYPLVQRFLGHSDLRVQFEALSSVVKIGGPQLNARLGLALNTVDETLQPHVLQLLSERAGKDEALLNAVLALLKNRQDFAPEIKDRMLYGAIAVLKAYPEPASIEILQRLTDEYRRGGGGVHLQLEEALLSLQPKYRHRLRRVNKQEEVSFDDDPLNHQKAMGQLKSIEEHLRAFLGKGDVAGATRYLKDQAGTAIREKKHILAEKIRDRLLQINPMALNEVIVLGEEIERSKGNHHTDPHLELWRDLLQAFNPTERKVFLSLMRPERVAKGDHLVCAGESDQVLYFLEAGQVSLHCHAGGKESFLKRLGPGTILGAEQFFSPSVWTITVRAASDICLQVIDANDFTEASENHLSLEPTLQGYCEKFTNVPQLLQMSGDERRDFPRFSVPLWTRNTLVDPFGKQGKRSFRGELLDISRSGLSFVIKISSRNSGKMLLGRQIHCDIEERGNLIMAKCTGGIVGVRYRDNKEKDATVHVKLAQRLDEAVFEKILSLR